MCIKPELWDSIAVIARELWDGFLDDFKGKYSFESALNPPSCTSHTNATIRAFFRYCAALRSPAESDGRVEANIINMDLGFLAKGGTAPASWLMVVASDAHESGCPTIVMDVNRLFDTLSMDAAIRAKSHLVLHEVGHLLFHWNDIEPKQKISDSYPMANKSTADHEAEAWWFCYSLLGYIVSILAKQTRIKNPSFADDRTWMRPFR